MKSSPERQRRSVYRIDYPAGAWAQVVFSKYIFRVLDLAENSFRFDAGPDAGRIPTEIQGTLVLLSRAKLPFVGSVTIKRGSQFVVKLKKPLPYFQVVKEQALFKKNS